MRWNTWGVALVCLLATTAGCKQEVFITQAEQEESMQLAISCLDGHPEAMARPITAIPPPPPTQSDPEQPVRYLSLAEAVSLALEQGETGPENNPLLNGVNVANNLANDVLGSFSGGRFNATSDAMKVLRLDPAIIGAGIESSLSKFDAVWSSSASWNTTDRPVGTSLDTFQSAGQVNVIQEQQAAVSTGFIKPLSTGGVASITAQNNYTNTNLPSRINPSYQPILTFGIEQPLMQGFGTEINELRPNSPGSLLHPGTFNTQPTAEGILVTRLRYDQQRVEFERNVHFMLLNVELAYWNLYYGYWNLYTQETGLRLAYEAWRIFNARFQAGKVNVADLAQTRGQYELFRSQRLSALHDVLEFERQLRALLGMSVSDGTRLVPADQPTLAPYLPDWNDGLQEAFAKKPELIMARMEVKAAQMNLLVARDSTRPDLRFNATYDFNDIGSRLDGPGTENAFRNLSNARFSDWTVGLSLNLPIGFRDANAKMRVAKLNLARSFETVREQELKVQRYMGKVYRELDYNYNLIKINRAQREAYGQQIRALAEQIRTGTQTPDVLLEAQRFYATALQGEYQAIANYNQALVGWEFMKGTILQHDNVVISEGALPGTAQMRAVEHQKERTKALVIREQATPVDCQPLEKEGTGVIPQIPTSSAMSLPSLMKEKQEPLPPPMELPPGTSMIMPKTGAANGLGATLRLNTTPLPAVGSQPDLPPLQLNPTP